jgi:hypothetical protein
MAESFQQKFFIMKMHIIATLFLFFLKFSYSQDSVYRYIDTAKLPLSNFNGNYWNDNSKINLINGDYNILAVENDFIINNIFEELFGTWGTRQEFTEWIQDDNNPYIARPRIVKFLGSNNYDNPSRTYGCFIPYKCTEKFDAVDVVLTDPELVPSYRYQSNNSTRKKTVQDLLNFIINKINTKSLIDTNIKDISQVSKIMVETRAETDGEPGQKHTKLYIFIIIYYYKLERPCPYNTFQY